VKEKTMNQAKASTLEQLKGRNLSAVTFVQDYLQLQFDGPFLNIFVWPRIMVSAKSIGFGMADYRDELCSQIGKTIGGVAVEADVSFRLYFTDGSIIEVTLLPKSRTGPESVVFQDGNGAFSVW
jgi:hypothetical protein